MTRLPYAVARAGDTVRGAKLEKAGRERDGWSRERLRAHQAERIDAIVRHAARHSRFYAERLAGRVDAKPAPSAAWASRPAHPATPVALADLPPLDKATMLDRFDDLVTDPRLKRDALLAHVEAADGDALLHGRYRVMATSGSSGRKGLFVYDRPAWQAVLAGFMRFTRLAGTSPRIPRRTLAYVGPSGGGHMSRRITTTLDVGLQRMHVLRVTDPTADTVAALNRIRPDTLAGFPSMVALLAHEQIAGRLRIAPSVVTTSSELRTPEMAAAIREAWGVDPFDLYALTEAGVVGCECAEHRGIHVFEDLVAIEVADADGRPVPDGETGAQLYVTSLDNRVQPTIRLAVADRVAFDREPCPCGRPFPLLRVGEGRTEEVLSLPAAVGAATVSVHPLQFAPVAQAKEVREFQVVQQDGRLRIRVALCDGAALAPLERRLSAEIGERLARLGAAVPEIRVEPCDRIERDPARMGKLQLVVAERG